VQIFDDDGRAVTGMKGELVCTRPFPSMPLGFLNDVDGSGYHQAYFDRYPGVWCHGDYAELTEHGGIVIHGRSDAVLNPGGVRIGTSEIYRVVEELPAVEEAVAVGQDWLDDTRIVLFVKLLPDITLSESLRAEIRQQLREHCSPRHVPAKILQVSGIPRTISGKVSELAVRAAIHGRPIANIAALANPESLNEFRNRAELSA
jgi:acetoacetyl-CoA synthetase